MPYVERPAESINQVPILTMIYCETCAGSTGKLDPHHHRHIIFIILDVAASTASRPPVLQLRMQDVMPPMTYYYRLSVKSLRVLYYSGGAACIREFLRQRRTISFRWFLGFLRVGRWLTST
jgi:hypothetical protein